MEGPSHASTVYSDQCYCFPLHSIGNWPVFVFVCFTVHCRRNESVFV